MSDSEDDVPLEQRGLAAGASDGPVALHGPAGGAASSVQAARGLVARLRALAPSVSAAEASEIASMLATARDDFVRAAGSATSSGVVVANGAAPTEEKKRRRRCGECAGCTRDDCGRCAVCQGKAKFGASGSQRRRQACIERKCTNMRVITGGEQQRGARAAAKGHGGKGRPLDSSDEEREEANDTPPKPARPPDFNLPPKADGPLVPSDANLIILKLKSVGRSWVGRDGAERAGARSPLFGPLPPPEAGKLPDGWECSSYVDGAHQFKWYRGPGAQEAPTLREAWLLHERAHGPRRPAKGKKGGTKRRRSGASEHASAQSADESESEEEGGEAPQGEVPDKALLQTDHEWVGQGVAARFGGKLFKGKVVGWYPPLGEDVALWHVQHEDGDEEDYEDWELQEAMALYKRRTSEREHLEVARLVEDKAFLGDAPSSATKAVAVKYSLVPRNDWRAFPKKLGGKCARNDLEWSGGLPLPLPPNPACWLLPVEDKQAVAIARHQQALAASGWRVLSGAEEVVARLSNKASFRAHAERIGQLRLLPQHYDSVEGAVYPCILKAAVGAYGDGTHIVRAADEVAKLAGAPLAAGELGSTWLLQELVRGPSELATSLLVAGGEVLDAITTSYEYDRAEYVWPQVKEITSQRRSSRDVPAAHLEQMRAFLDGYEGILNFNYKVRESGELCIFEINTRLGADLGCDVPTPMLREFFSRLDALQASREEQQARGAAPPAAG